MYYITHVRSSRMQETQEFQVLFAIIQNQMIGIAGNTEGKTKFVLVSRRDVLL